MNASQEPKRKWSEINKQHKEDRKKWKEEKLAKKLQQLQDTEKQTDRQTQPDDRQLSTISIAVPGSILENAQSAELRTYLAGQIARAACIFQVNEVVVFDDCCDQEVAKKSTLEDSYGFKTARQSSVQLGRILQYLECPQYLRKHFFPIHKDLQFAGLLNPLDAPHHLRQDNDFAFREGVVTTKRVKEGRGSQINVGLHNDVHVDKLLVSGIRCTVKLLPKKDESKRLKGIIVSPTTPTKETGVYWGYSVRLAKSLSHVFSQSPYKDGYDLTIGTSDKGTSVDDFKCPRYNHMLVMFGGLQGLEAALENDEQLTADDPSLLFDFYLNTLIDQGSRTIRTEEAILVSLAALRPKLRPNNPPVKVNGVVRME